MNEVAPPGPTRHKLSVSDFVRIVDAGIIPAAERVELIDGTLIDMAPIGSDHAGTVNYLTRALVLACGEAAVVTVQNPVILGEFSQPQPDVAVCRERADFYRDGHATPSDVLLLVEVANSSLDYDRTTKLPLYAAAGIPEYWIVDLPNRTLLVHRHPSGDAYADVQALTAPTRIALAAAPSISLDLTPLFALLSSP